MIFKIYHLENMNDEIHPDDVDYPDYEFEMDNVWEEAAQKAFEEIDEANEDKQCNDEYFILVVDLIGYKKKFSCEATFSRDLSIEEI